MNLNSCINYGGLIKAFKEEHKLKTSDVAEYLGIDYHTVLSWNKVIEYLFTQTGRIHISN